MSVLIVNALEVVYIDHRNNGLALADLPQGRISLNILGQLSPIWQARQGILLSAHLTDFCRLCCGESCRNLRGHHFQDPLVFVAECIWPDRPAVEQAENSSANDQRH